MLRQIFKISVFAVLVTAFYLLFDLADPVEPEVLRPKRMADKGIYITAYMAQAPVPFAQIKQQAAQSGINTIVVDAKHILSQPLLESLKKKELSFMTRVDPDPWLSKLTDQLHRQGFVVSARLVVFKDDHLVIARPDLAARMPDGSLYRDHKWGRWADPYSDEVRLYNELIALRAALSGVDEVQFDYIRFPAEGKAYQAVFPHQKAGISRVEIINTFLKDVRRRLTRFNTSIAVDIFGVTAWQSQRDITLLGQDLKKMAKYIDVLSPMFYPSHFHAGYDGFANPGEHPYYFVHSGVKKTIDILSGEAVTVVPWIQGFDLRSPNFGPDYIQAQIQACLDAGTSRFLVWNASNKYWVTFTALQKKRVTDKTTEAHSARNPQ
ncbi:MAG: hypothetical protein JW782_05720 [Candidatus Saganbacteria bacterium]|nr:hypothetical protein [Candidatus Saganbacteria bacterium]